MAATVCAFALNKTRPPAATPLGSALASPAVFAKAASRGLLLRVLPLLPPRIRMPVSGPSLLHPSRVLRPGSLPGCSPAPRRCPLPFRQAAPSRGLTLLPPLPSRRRLLNRAQSLGPSSAFHRPRLPRRATPSPLALRSLRCVAALLPQCLLMCVPLWPHPTSLRSLRLLWRRRPLPPLPPRLWCASRAPRLLLSPPPWPPPARPRSMLPPSLQAW